MMARILTAAVAVSLSATMATSTLAQTGTLDQDNTVNNNVSWNMQFNLDLQQDIYVGVAGQLEGVMIRMWGAAGKSLPVAIFNGAGPHPLSATPDYATTAVAAVNGWQEVFVDCTVAALTFNVGDIYTLRVGDGVTVPTGVDLTGNQGWPTTYYPYAHYNDQNYEALTRIYFKSYMIACPSPAVPYGQGCPGSFGIEPNLSLQGCPAAGAPITLSIADGLSGSTAILLLGLGQVSVPVGSGCTVLVSPLVGGPLSGLPLNGAGSLSIPAVIPAGASGASFTLQAFVVDPANSIGVSATNALAISIP